MNFDDYRAIDAVNWSSLKVIRISPKHYQHARTAGRTDAPFFRVGRACHAFILEPDDFARNYVCYSDGHRRGKAWDAFQAEHEGKTILNQDEWTRALGAATAVMDHPVARSFLAAGLREATFTWTDPDTNLVCKGRIDHAGSHLVDLKSTANLDPRMFASAAARLGYVGQVAFYLDGLRANAIAVRDEPVLIAVESSPPHDVVAYRVPVDVVEQGRAEYKQMLALLQDCRERDYWPGRSDDLVDLALPAWAVPYDDGLVLDVGGEAFGV